MKRYLLEMDNVTKVYSQKFSSNHSSYSHQPPGHSRLKYSN